MGRPHGLGVSVIIAGLFSAAPAAADIVTFRVGSWNMESGESSDEHLKAQIGEKAGIDPWGFSEVENQAAVSSFEEGAEIGESANFETILGTTGGADRLAIVYNAERLELLGSEELTDASFSDHRRPLVAHFRGIITGVEFKFMVNHLARRNASARLEQAQFLQEWAQSESVPVIASGDYNFDFHVEFGDDGERDPGFDAMLAGGEWIWVRPDTLIKTQATDGFMSVLDFIFVANPLPGITAESVILERDGDHAAVEIDFGDSEEDTDHRPVVALFTIGTEGPAIEDLDEDQTASADFDRDAVLARISELERELRELRAIIGNQ